MFRVGAGLIVFSFVFLFVRDLIVLPKISGELSVPPLVGVSALHLLGVLLFLSLTIAPEFVLYVAVLGAIGLGFFFAGMADIPVIETRLSMGWRPVKIGPRARLHVVTGSPPAS